MKKVVITLLILVVAAAGATFWRYQSFDPCEWLKQDMAAKSDLPGLFVEGQIRWDFLFDGVADPDGMQCLKKWWNFRADEEPKKAS